MCGHLSGVTELPVCETSLSALACLKCIPYDCVHSGVFLRGTAAVGMLPPLRCGLFCTPGLLHGLLQELPAIGFLSLLPYILHWWVCPVVAR